MRLKASRTTALIFFRLRHIFICEETTNQILFLNLHTNVDFSLKPCEREKHTGWVVYN